MSPDERDALSEEVARARRRRVRFERELDLLRVAAGRNEARLHEAQAPLRRRLVRWAVVLTEWIDALRARVRPARGGKGAPPDAAPRPASSPRITPARPTLAIHIVPESWEIAETWGDTVFARGLQTALERHRPRALVVSTTTAAMLLPPLDVPHAVRQTQIDELRR